MKLVKNFISTEELKKMSKRLFGGMVKAVVDIKKGLMVADAAMHADEEKYLLENGSNQNDLWGINLYPDLKEDDFIEFDSLINVRPRLNNFTRGIADEKIKQKITIIVNRLVKK